MSPESRYLRFFAAMPRLPDRFLGDLLNLDGWNRVAIGAESATVGPQFGDAFGVARFVRLAEEPETAEAAVTVVDCMQRRGLGRLLLRALAAAARERGITKFRAEVLRGNEAMAALLREFDGEARPIAAEGGVAVYEIHLGQRLVTAATSPEPRR